MGKVVTAPPLHTPELNELASWAHESTPKDALFQFADVRRGLEPGVFRARAMRAIWADWKAGGQSNFMSSFATEWARRWKIADKPQTLAKYRELGIDYVVFSASKAPKDAQPVYSNPTGQSFAWRRLQPVAVFRPQSPVVGHRGGIRRIGMTPPVRRVACSVRVH